MENDEKLTPQEEEQQPTATPAARERMLQKLNEQNPELTYDDDEALLGAYCDYVQGVDDELARLKQQVERHEQMKQTNIDQSAQCLAQFLQKYPMEDEEYKRFMSRLKYVLVHMLHYDLTEEVLDVILKGMRYDAAVAEERHIGEVKGRNERIADKRQELAGDNLPRMEHLNNSGSAPGGYRRARRNRSVWDL